MQKTKTFFEQMITEGNPKSSRRFVTLAVSGLFIVTCATVLLLLVCLFISTKRLQGLNATALGIIVDLLKEVLKYEMFIILAGLFFTTLSARFKLLDAFAGIFSKKTVETNSQTTTVTKEEGEIPPNYIPPPGDT
jgi:hypothetical protein